MKNLKFGLLGLVAVGLLTFSSCKDLCKDVNCNNGTCDEATGDCLCDTGYEGADCATRGTAKFVGSFGAVETCNSVSLPAYTATIAESSTEVTKVNISNLYDMTGYYGISSPVVATVEGTTLTIANQSFTFTAQGGGTLSISGTGTISANNNTISLTYTATVNGTADNCTTALTRQ